MPCTGSAICSATRAISTPPRVFVLRGPAVAVDEWVAAARLRLGPDGLMLALPNGLELPAALDKPESDRAVAWICSGSSCRPPVTRLADGLDRDEKTTPGNDAVDDRSDPT